MPKGRPGAMTRMLPLAALLGFALILFGSHGASADRLSVGEVYDTCRGVADMNPGNASGADRARFMQCFYFFDGLVEALEAAEALSEHAGVKSAASICYPKGVTMAQRIRVFEKWATEYPEEHHRGAAVGVMVSLRRAFPCN